MGVGGKMAVVARVRFRGIMKAVAKTGICSSVLSTCPYYLFRVLLLLMFLLNYVKLMPGC